MPISTKIVETSDEWITTRTGIKQRRKAAPDEYTSLFAVRAARQAIERARLDPADIDLLLCATVTPDQILPSTGCIIQAELGANNAAAMDIVAACSGFFYGVIAGRFDDPNWPGATCGGRRRGDSDAVRRLHGSTDVRVVWRRRRRGGAWDRSRGVVAFSRAKIKSDGRYEEQLFSPGGGTRRKPTAETLAAGDHFFKMKGNELSKLRFVRWLRSRAKCSNRRA